MAKRKNKRNVVRLLVVLLIAVLCSGLLSCGYTPIDRTEQEAASVGTVDGYEIAYDELRYITMIFKDQMATTYGKDIWDSSESSEKYREELEEKVASAIKQDRAVISLAEGFGYSLDSKDVVEYVDEFVSDLVKELGGVRKYKKYLAENYMSDAFLRLTIATDYLESVLLYGYINLEIITDDMQEIYNLLTEDEMCLHTKHIFISEEADGRSREQSQALADEIYQKLRDGASFEELAAQYNEDTALDMEEGMYFLRGEVDGIYFDTAEELRNGKYSKVISSAGGYVIIKRFRLDEQYVMMNISDLTNRYQYSVLDGYITEARDEMTFVPNELFNSIDLTKMQ